MDAGYLKEGYIHVEIHTRGKESTNDAGEYIGQFPLIMVDLKAGVRFLKAFDDVLPGNSERIVSRGYSSADASYEWYQYANEKYFLFNAMAFDRLGNPLENFPVGPKNKYTLGSNVLGDDGRSGVFYDGFAEIYADALEEYINAIMVKEDQVPVVELPAQPETPAEPETPVEPAAKTYTVKAGDPLWKIAAKQLGKGTRWGEIYEANKGTIKKAELIYVGQVLIIP